MGKMFYPSEFQKVEYAPEKLTADAPKKKSKSMKSDSANSNQCKICGLINFNAWSLTIHMRRHNNERPAKCSYCPASFVNNTELKSHVASHTKEKRYKCRFCTKLFTNNSSKYVHEDSHGILVHKCKYCDQKFYSQVQRRTHQKTHAKEGLSCRFCIKKFGSEEFLKLHERRDHVKVLNCIKCQIKFQNFDELYAHKKWHKANRKECKSKRSNEVDYFQDADIKLSTYFFTCQVCSEKFSFRLELSQHIESVHPDLKDSIYKFKCTKCTKSFDTKMKLRGHMIGHGPRKHKCTFCSYSSTRGKDLSKHVETKHSTSKNYKCSECSSLFTHYSTFVNHKMKHGEKKFKCDMCDKAYYVKSRLSNHKRISHYSAKPVCDQCGKVFRNIITLRAHQRRFHNRPLALCMCNLCGSTIYINEVISHKNICPKGNYNKSFQKIQGPLCAACNITFSTQRDLVDHFKDVHPSSVYPCKFCHKEYLSPDLTKKHIERKHMPDRPLLHKHKHILTLEEKRILKENNNITWKNAYECFACGEPFTTEDDLDTHMNRNCLRTCSNNAERELAGQLFAISKVYENHSRAQVLCDYDVRIIPTSLKAIPILTTISSSTKNEVKQKTKKRGIKTWVPLENVPLESGLLESGLLNSVPLNTGPLNSVPLNSVPLNSVPLNTGPLNSVPLNSAPLNSVPLNSAPLNSVPLNTGPLNTVPLNTGPLNSVPLNSVPLNSVPLNSVPLNSVPLTSVPQNDTSHDALRHRGPITPPSGTPFINTPSPTDIPQTMTPNPQNIEKGSLGSGSIVSSQELLKILKQKTVNVDGTPFIPFNELFNHLKLISGVEMEGN